ncbi:MAG: hypothetical protein L6408_08570 [Nanoarchaeota archaeon]|nr:hypothetical protein [Nanoarchaeota archaeon]
MKYVAIKGNEKYYKHDYREEDELKDIFSKHYQQIASEKSLWIPLEKQLKSKRFKNFKQSIGDGFLLAWDNPTTPTLYITEIELEKHDINRHVLPQLGNFISFIQSATKEELTDVRNFLYEEIKKKKTVFDKIGKDTGKEIHELLEDSMEDLQILLIIDRIGAELSIGLDQIEKAIKVKIRKIEVSGYYNDKKEDVILSSDSEVSEEELKPTIPEEYTLEYHLDGKPKKIVDVVKKFIRHIENKKVKYSPTKHYIGFYKEKNMIFSCVVRKSSVIFYSKAKINVVKNKELHMRDVSDIGHYTNHLPTEIVLTDPDQIKNLIKYFEKLWKRF